MKKTIHLILMAVVMPLFTSNANASPETEVDQAKANMVIRKVGKVMPLVEKQTELIIKMVGNDKYRAKLEPEFATAIGVALSGNFEQSRIDSVKEKWKGPGSLSFFAGVLKIYKAPLSKTCIPAPSSMDPKSASWMQPLHPLFPHRFLSGSIMGKRWDYDGLGYIDLRTLDKSVLVEMSMVSNQLIELHKALRDGISDKFDLDRLKKHGLSIENVFAPRANYGAYGFSFGPALGQGESSCGWYLGKAINDNYNYNLEHYWVAMGYELLLPTDFFVECRWCKSKRTAYGGGKAILYLSDLPEEYIGAWRNLLTYYRDYLPVQGEAFYDEIIVEIDAMLAEKAEEPLGDLMSEDSDTDKTDDDDGGLALPSLD